MASRRLNPAAWMEGMFLRPHHLQHLDVSADERLLYHVRVGDPFHYGIRALELDPDALSNNSLEIRRLEAVLPGGTVIRYPENAIIEPRKFEGGDSFSVWAGIRLLSPNEANSIPEGSDSGPMRWLIRSNEYADLNRADAKGEIQQLYPHLRLFVTGEEPEVDLYDSIKLVEVEATGDMSQPFLVKPSYVPPLLAIQAWLPLANEVEELVNRMAGKIRMVAGERGSLTALDVRRILMWYTLARMAPVLKHHLSTGDTHPFVIYSILIEVAASVSALNREELLSVADYDHLNLYACFRHVIDIINEELEHEFTDRSEEIPMSYERRLNGYATSGRLTLEQVDDDNSFYLAIKADLGQEELKELVLLEAKIGPIQMIDQMTRKMVRGVKFELMEGPPHEVPVQKQHGRLFLQLDHRDSGAQLHWGRVKQSRSIALNLGGLSSAGVSLFIVKPSQAD